MAGRGTLSQLETVPEVLTVFDGVSPFVSIRPAEGQLEIEQGP